MFFLFVALAVNKYGEFDLTAVPVYIYFMHSDTVPPVHSLLNKMTELYMLKSSPV